MIAIQSAPSLNRPAALSTINGGTGPFGFTRPRTLRIMSDSSGVAPASPLAIFLEDEPIANTMVPIESNPPFSRT